MVQCRNANVLYLITDRAERGFEFMRVGCIYSIENYCSIDKPMRSPMEIPFGISIIATVLKVASHDVDLFVNFNQRMFNHLFLIPTWEQIGDF